MPSVKQRINDVNNLKFNITSRLYWGRSNFYKNLTYVIILSITLSLIFAGVVSRFAGVSGSAIFLGDSNIYGLVDLLPQGGSIESVLVSSPGIQDLKVTTHVVAEGENLDSIAQTYGRKVETIRWMNKDIVSPFTNILQPGWVLKIPTNMDGVLYTVKAGQTIEDIIRDAGSNEFDIVEFNNLSKPYALAVGQQLFIPDGTLYSTDFSVEGIPRDVFSNPVANPDCGGYIVTRGFLSYHNGVDLAKWPGCPISAVANGTVIYAGWYPAMGNNVQIDHGGGIITHYYHGSEVYVRTGQRVSQGDLIMYMGTTGNSTGVHLHFTLFKNGVAVDPEGFVPF